MRWWPDLFGVDPGRIARLRTLANDGHQVFRPFPYAGYVAKVQAGQEQDPTRPRDWRFAREKRPAVTRIACLGGSTTHAGYPWMLQQLLEERTGAELDVMNWGVPAWTTQETLVNYVTTVQDYEPDVVIVHHALNDVPPRLRHGFRGDYSHYRRTWRGPELGRVQRWWMLESDLYAGLVARNATHFALGSYVFHGHGVRADAPAEDLPAGTDFVFRRNLSTLATLTRADGAALVLVTMPYDPEEAYRADGRKQAWAAGVDQHNAIVRELCAERGALLVDVAAEAEARPDAAARLFVDQIHTNRAGERLKVERIADALLAAGLVGDGGPALSGADGPAASEGRDVALERAR